MAKDGKLYTYREKLEKNNDGYYGNPGLVVIDIWKEVEKNIH